MSQEINRGNRLHPLLIPAFLRQVARIGFGDVAIITLGETFNQCAALIR